MQWRRIQGRLDTILSADLRRLALIFAIGWPLFGVGMALLSLPLMAETFDPQLFRARVTAWSLWALLSPFVIVVADRHRFVKGRLLRTLLTHLAAAILIGFAHLFLNALQQKIRGVETSTITLMAIRFENFFRYQFLNYALVVGTVVVGRRRRIARRSELARARLERSLARTRLKAVVFGLDGERVFAALDEIEAQLGRNHARAEELLHGLSAALRVKLQRIAGAAPRRAVRRRPAAKDVRVIPLVMWMYVVFGLYLLVLTSSFAAYSATPMSPRLAAVILAGYVAAALLSPVVVLAARRLVAPPGRRRSVLVDLVVTVAVCLAHAVVIEALTRSLGQPPGWLFATVLILSLIAAYVTKSDELELRRRRTRIAAEELARLMAEARLQSLRTQLAPHFLFNALNSVMALLQRDHAGARQMLVRLRRLLQRTLSSADRQEMTLREDLDITASYIDIERVRYRDALDVTIDVPPEHLDACVPAFLLQPLVENAIRHGALATMGRGRVSVSAERDRESLAITVANDGELLDVSGWREGIGLSNVRNRLAQLYGSEQELTMHVDESSGVTVRLRIPYHAPAPEVAA